MPSSNGLLVITVEPKAEKNISCCHHAVTSHLAKEEK
jgi:hypothetical protein